jgi:hypothetical protein
MKARQTEIELPTMNAAIMAETLGKIYVIMTKPGTTPARKIIDKAKLQQLIHHLMTAPEDMLPSC